MEPEWQEDTQSPQRVQVSPGLRLMMSDLFKASYLHLLVQAMQSVQEF